MEVSLCRIGRCIGCQHPPAAEKRQAADFRWRMILSENRYPLFGIMRSLLWLDPGADDHVMPLFEIGCDAVGKLLRRARPGVDTEFCQCADRVAVAQDRIHLGIE